MFGVNPYNLYGYNPPFSSQQVQQSQFFPQNINNVSSPFQSTQATQNGPGWIMAPTVQSVEQVSVSPGGKSWIMVQNAPIFALRTADQMGLITTEYYRFEKIDPSSVTSTNSSNEYITRHEFEQFVESLRSEGHIVSKEDLNK